MGNFSRRQIDDFLPRKQDLTFHANCGDNLHKMSNLIFWEKYFKMSAEKLYTHAKR